MNTITVNDGSAQAWLMPGSLTPTFHSNHTIVKVYIYANLPDTFIPSRLTGISLFYTITGSSGRV